MKSTEIREGVRFRNHISIILEQTGAVIAAIIVIVITQLVQSADEIADMDFSFITGRGFLILLGVMALLALTLIVQALVWARTYISIDESAIVIEKGRVNKKKNTIRNYYKKNLK